MILGIQQPFFFPYLDYFAYIKVTDRWIVLDNVQFTQRAWVNRNRILEPYEGWKYITVPVKKHKLKAPINSIVIQNDAYWKQKILSQLEVYKKIAPFYPQVNDMIASLFKNDFEYLSVLNVQSIKFVCDYIGIEFNYEVYSEMGLEVEPIQGPDEWALNICKATGDTHFINPFTGQKFMDKNKYQNNGVELDFLKFEQTAYYQKRKPFEPGLSVIDVLMFNSPETVNEMLDNYQLV